jgi:hypothetical protein
MTEGANARFRASLNAQRARGEIGDNEYYNAIAALNGAGAGEQVSSYLTGATPRISLGGHDPVQNPPKQP